MEEVVRMAGVVAVGWAVTFALRALPFALFAGYRGELPRWVGRFGSIVSPVIIAALIVYSYSGLEWRTAWPYLAGALTVGLQLAFRSGLVSILAGTALYMFLVAGCASYGTIELDARRPEIRVSQAGVSFGKELVEPEKVPKILDSYDVPRDRTIHILVDGDLRDLSLARRVMSNLAKSGYRRPVLVTERHADAYTPTHAPAVHP